MEGLIRRISLSRELGLRRSFLVCFANVVSALFVHAALHAPQVGHLTVMLCQVGDDQRKQ